MEKFYTVKKSCDENQTIKFSRLVETEDAIRKKREDELRIELRQLDTELDTTSPFEGEKDLPAPIVKKGKAYATNLLVSAVEGDSLFQVTYDLWTPTVQVTTQLYTVSEIGKTGPFWNRKKLYLRSVRAKDCEVIWTPRKETYLASSVEYKDLVFNKTTIIG